MAHFLSEDMLLDRMKNENNVNWFNQFNDLCYAFLYQIYTPDKYFYISNSYIH